MRGFSRLKKQPSIHYYILFINITRKIKHVIGKQDSTIKLSPRRN